MEENTDYLTVSALTKYIKYKFDCDRHLQSVLLQGEISNFKHNQKGHFYFSLKDEKAAISCAMFSSYAAKVLFEPKDGMKVFVRGKVTIYEPSGTYSINITEMKSDGIGDLMLQFERLKKEMMQEGYFDVSHKRKIKRIPQTIGVITSPTGAAIRDIINTINRRYPFTRVILYPAIVQGPDAKQNIVKMIEQANKDNLADTLIVGRGGGSIEDLWAFNEKIVALAIYNSSIPVITGIGHEIDFTISDYVSDLRAPTPTAAAELATPDVVELRNEILTKVYIMYKDLKNKIENYKVKLMHLDERLDNASPGNKIIQNKKDLKSLINRLNNQMNNILYQERIAYDALNKRFLLNNPLNIINDKRDGLRRNLKLLNKNINIVIQNKTNEFNIYKEKLNALSPLNLMDKGYSIPRVNGKAIRSVKMVKKDSLIDVSMKDGDIKAKVLEVVSNGEGK